MTIHLQALDVWETVEEDYKIPPLRDNPTMTHMKIHKEKKMRKASQDLFIFCSFNIDSHKNHET